MISRATMLAAFCDADDYHYVNYVTITFSNNYSTKHHQKNSLVAVAGAKLLSELE